MYFYVILFAHCALCAVLVGLVLLQQGKGADAGATFGGGGSNTVFGAAGAADFITKLTTSLAIGFMVTSILLVNAFQSTDIASVDVSTTVVDPTANSVMPQDAPPVEVEVEELATTGADETAQEEPVAENAAAATTASAEEAEAAVTQEGTEAEKQ